VSSPTYQFVEDDVSTHRCPTPLGYKEIAVFLDVGKTTPSRWAQRRHQVGFPLPDGHVSGVPYWWDTTIETWARRTGRWETKGRGAAERLKLERDRQHAEQEAEERRQEAERLRIHVQALQAELERVTAAQAAAEAAARAAGSRAALAG
jgi:hypothetical protein